MNNTFYKKHIGFLFELVLPRLLKGLCALFLMMGMWLGYTMVHSAELIHEPVQACVVARDVELTDALRSQFAQCLGWYSDPSLGICRGAYQPITVTALDNADEVQILADNASFYQEKPSVLEGHVEIHQAQSIISAKTAYVYRDAKTHQITKIEFINEVHYREPGKLIIARKARINPQEKSGEIEDVLYRFNTERSKAILPAWGRASLLQRFANKNYLLKKVTYTTCAPQDKAWDIRADSITIDDAHAKGVVRNAVLRVHNWPVFYTPYLSFPTNKERKSGFLTPIVGYSNIGGGDLALPYYWNMAPNYDMTLIPHWYTKRGLMMGGEFRYLTTRSNGILRGNFLPDDKAFNYFLDHNAVQFPAFRRLSRNRWSYDVIDTSNIAPNLQFNVAMQEVSDDYYLQDFSTNLALITQRQLVRQADLNYSTDHWLFRGMMQSYHTLQPVNEAPIAPVYERLPQLMANGYYDELPFDANVSILGQYDQFRWPGFYWFNNSLRMPEGPRFHLNPTLTLPIARPWGYLTPSVQVVENYYEVGHDWFQDGNSFDTHFFWQSNTFNFNHFQVQRDHVNFNRTIPRYSVDGGLYFERNAPYFTQTLEPRLFYLNVPFQNQTPIPVYDSGFMIFNVDQLFRTNRFSGYDRIGDANQLAYALTSRWLSQATGLELADFSIGQIRYFSNRRVQLCQSPTGFCVDNPDTFGSLSSTAKNSPLATRANYYFNRAWGLTGDYVWDPATHATNNGDLNVHYQPRANAIINLGYTYLVNSDGRFFKSSRIQDNALHQAIVSFAWPLSERWGTLGAFSYNISKQYNMMSLLGVQYDSCCWAMRILGGRTFKNLNASFGPEYNDNISLQILLKGLGSMSYSDPSNLLSTYIPGYNDLFSH